MANLNFNKVMLGGRLTGDPELKQTPSGVSVTSFSIAVNRRFGGKSTGGSDEQAGGQQQTQADFINVTAWRQTAEFISRFFRKGSSIFIVGSIQTRTWTDQQGAKRYATDVVADEAYFVDSKSENPASGAGQGYMPDSYNAPAFSSQSGTTPKFEEISDDDDLPF